MAINVNKVYKKVLSIINKEQRGFITPDEFNKYATNAQLQLLDIAFSDFTSVSNLDTAMRTNMGYADIPSKIKEKIDQFYKTTNLTMQTSGDPAVSTGIVSLPNDIYKVIQLTNSTRTLPFELVDKHELPYLLSSPLTAPSTDYPIYYKTTTLAGATSVQVNPISIGTAVIDYIKVPSNPRFGYTVNATYGTNTYDENIYVADGLAIASDGLTTRTTISSGATNGTYTGTVGTTPGFTGSGTGTIAVTVAGNAVTNVEITGSGAGHTVGSTITVASSVIGGSTNLVITIGASDLLANTTQGSTDFELHPSEEPALTTSILMLAGISMKDREIVSLSGQAIQANAVAKKL